MEISIGKTYIGYRSHDSHLWKKYLLPKYYNSPKSKHCYYKFYIRWLNFFICKPRKCECCGKYMDSKGGTHIWDIDGNKKLITICRTCEKSKEYIDADGREYTGYSAWLQEMWQ